MLPIRSRIATLSTCILTALAGCQEATQPDLASSKPTLAAAKAETSTVVEVFPVEFTATLFCTNEEVAWSGRVVLVRHTTFNRGLPPAPDFFQHLIEVDNVHFTGIGLSSGDTYRYHARLNHSFQSPDPDDPFPTTDILAFRERIVGPGGVIGVFTFNLRFVVSGSGEVVIEVVDVDEECR